MILSDIDFTAVHIFENSFHIGVFDVFEYNDRMATWEIGKEALKIRGASCEDHFVAFDRGATVTGEGDIRESLILKKLVEYGEEIGPVVVPP